MQLGGTNKIKNVKVFKTGSCSSYDFIARAGGKFKQVHFPSLAFLIDHEDGYVLFDTGYGDHFFTASESFPYKLYRYGTPVTYSSQDSLKIQLQNNGINADEIKTIVLSHFHGDHTGGLLDFPNAKIICSNKAWEAIRDCKGVKAVRQAYLPGTIPIDFSERAVFIEETPILPIKETHTPFTKGYDILGDGSIIAVFLEGHAKGQFGIFFNDIFLCADATWSSAAIRAKSLPNRAAGLIMSSWKEYKETFDQVVDFLRLHPEFQIIPSHCTEVSHE